MQSQCVLQHAWIKDDMNWTRLNTPTELPSVELWWHRPTEEERTHLTGMCCAMQCEHVRRTQRWDDFTQNWHFIAKMGRVVPRLDTFAWPGMCFTESTGAEGDPPLAFQ
jgi:hypothetical protein